MKPSGRISISFVISAITILLGAVPALADGVLVFGGTGRLGSEIVKQLAEAGEEVTVFARPTSKRELLEGLNVSYAVGDVLNEADVEATFKSRSFRVAINALGSRGNPDRKDFYKTSQEYITKWAKESGVKRVIMHSSVGAGESRAVYPDEAFNRFGYVILAKEAGENNLISSGLDYTIIRNFEVEPETHEATGNAHLTEDQTATGPVTRADLAILTRDCLDAPGCAKKIYHAVEHN